MGLSSGKECTGCAQDCGGYGVNVTLSQDAQGNTIAKLRIHSGEPRLHHGRRITFAQGSHNLIGKPQSGFGIPVEFAAGRPTIHCARILHSTYISSELASDNLDQRLDDLRGR
jgi:hypothetical protein